MAKDELFCLISKMNTKNLCGSPAEIKKRMKETGNDGKGKNMLLFTVGGVTNRFISGEGNYGEWHGFVGKFQAVVPGEEKPFRSTKFYPPRSLAEDIINNLTPDSNGEISECQFLANVYVTTSEKSNTGYEYIIDPIEANNAADPLTKLFAEKNAGVPRPQKQLPQGEKEKTGKEKDKK
jgi:hypothetical protein